MNINLFDDDKKRKVEPKGQITYEEAEEKRKVESKKVTYEDYPTQQTRPTTQQATQQVTKQVTRPTQTVQRVTLQDLENSYNSAQTDSEEEKRLDAQLRQFPTEYDRITRTKKGTWTEQDKKNYQFNTANSYRNRIRDLNSRQNLTEEERNEVAQRQARINTIRPKQASELTDEEAKMFGAVRVTDGNTYSIGQTPTGSRYTIREGLIKSDEVARLSNVGVNSSATTPQADQNGLISGFSGAGIVNITPFANLTGQEYRNAVAKKYASFLTQDEDVQNTAIQAVNSLVGDTFVSYVGVGDIPLEDFGHTLEMGNVVRDGDQTFTLYQDKGAILPTMVYLAEAIKAKNGSVTQEELMTTYREYAKIRDDYNKEINDIIVKSEETAKSDKEMGTLQSLGNSLWQAFGAVTEPTDREASSLASRLERDLFKTIINKGNGVYERNENVFNSLSRLSSINQYQQNTRMNTVLEKLSREKSGSAVVTLTYMMLPQLIPFSGTNGMRNFERSANEFSKRYGLTNQFLNTQILQLAPALLPNVSIPYMLSLTEAQTRDLSPNQRYLTMGITAVTMGASKLFSSKLAQAIAPRTSAVSAGLSNIGGAVAITGINWESFKNQDGSIRWGDVIGNSLFDVAQLGGTDLPEITKAFLGREPKFISGLVIQDADGKGFYAFVQDEQGLSKLVPVSEDTVNTVRESAVAQKKPFIIQTLNQNGIDSVMRSNPSFGQRLSKALLGKETRLTELTASRDVLMVDGKEVRIYTQKDWDAMPEIADYTDRSYELLGALSESPINVFEMNGDASFVQTVKNLQKQGLIKLDNGKAVITDSGSMFIQKRLELDDRTRKSFESNIEKLSKQEINTGQVIGELLADQNPKTEQYVRKYIQGTVDTLKNSRQDEPTINIPIEELSGMGDIERKVIENAVALGKLNYENGYITNKPFTDDYNNQVISFGNTASGKQEQLYYRLGKAISENDTELQKAIIEDFGKFTEIPETELRKLGEERFKYYTEQADKRIAELGDEKYVIELEKPTPKETVEVNETKTEISPTKPSIYESTIAQKKVTDYNFVKLGEDETLPKNDTLVVKDTSNNKTYTFVKDNYGLYRTKGQEGAFTASKIEDLARQGKFEIAKPKEFGIIDTVKNYFKPAKIYDLPVETHISNKQSYESGKGELRPDTKTTLKVEDFDKFHFEQSKADPSRLYVSQDALNVARAVINENPSLIYRGGTQGNAFDNVLTDAFVKNVDDLEKVKLEFDGNELKINPDNRLDRLSVIKNYLSESDLKTLYKMRDAIKNNRSNDLVAVNKNIPYETFVRNSVHEGTHKKVFDNVGTQLLDDYNDIFSGDIQRIRKQGSYNDVDDNVFAHEIIAFATDEKSTKLLGVKDEKDAEVFAQTYVKLLKSIKDKYGDKALQAITEYADAPYKEAIKELYDNTGTGLKDTRGTGGRSPIESGKRTDVFSVREEWRGSGNKYVRLQRLTQDGNPFSFTRIGYNAGDLNRKTRTFNFFVAKEDGTFVYEPLFTNTKLLPFEIEGNFRLADLGNDLEAWEMYKNNSYDNFQKWAESRGYDGFFSGRDDLPDYMRYRVSLFDNQKIRNILTNEFSVKSEVSYGFFAPIEEALTSRKIPEKSTGDQYLNILRNFGITKEELDWSGVGLYLEGNPKVNKQELLELAKQGRVTVEEKILGGINLDQIRKELLEVEEEIMALQRAGVDPYSPEMSNLISKSIEVKLRYGAVRESEPPKYATDTLTLSGNRTNDVELLLTIPNLEKGNTKGNTDYSNTFIGSHYEEEPNLIVHIRGNERDTGVRTFHVEEFQSDLHQQGRELGYRSNQDPPELEQLREDRRYYYELIDSSIERAGQFPLENERPIKTVRDLQSVLRMYSSLELTQKQKSRQSVLRDYEEQIGLYSSKIYELGRKIDSILLRFRIEQHSKIPDAPFKDNWHELGFKKALQYAVRKGYDKMTWTTGKQQIDRYKDMFRQNVDTIDFSPSKEKNLAELENLIASRNLIQSKISELDSRLEQIDKTYIEGLAKVQKEKTGDELSVAVNGLAEVLAYSKDKINAEKGNYEYQLTVVNIDIKNISDSSRVFISAKKENETVFEEHIPLEGSVTLNGTDVSLEGLLGRDFANKIREQKSGTLKGEDFSIGGQFHKLLYDQKLPKFAQKYAKQWGAVVSKADLNNEFITVGELGTKINFKSQEEIDGLTNYLRDNKFEVYGQIKGQDKVLLDLQGSYSVPDDFFNYEQYTVRSKSQQGEVWSINITPQMRESVIDGQPLFGTRKEFSIKEEDIVNPIDRNLSQEEKVSKLVELSKESEKIINSVADEIRNLGLDVKTSYKEPDKILSKANRPSILAEKEWFNVEHIRDAFRFKAQLNGFDDIIEIARILKNKGVEFVKIDTAKMFNPKEWGWRFVGFDLRMPNGQLVEFYAPLKELDLKGVKDVNHEIFEKWRGKTAQELTAQAVEYGKDIQDSYDRYTDAWNKALKRNGYNSEAEAKADWTRVLSSLESVTRSNESFNSSTVKEPLDQTPPTRTIEKGNSPLTVGQTKTLSDTLSTDTIINNSIAKDGQNLNFANKLLEVNGNRARFELEKNIIEKGYIPQNISRLEIANLIKSKGELLEKYKLSGDWFWKLANDVLYKDFDRGLAYKLLLSTNDFFDKNIGSVNPSVMRLYEQKNGIQPLDFEPQYRPEVKEKVIPYEASEFESFRRLDEQKEFSMRTEDPQDVRNDRLMKFYYGTNPKDANVAQIGKIVKEGFFSAIESDDMGSLAKDLDSMGYHYIESEGIYSGTKSKSFIVYYPDKSTSNIIEYLGKKHNQESVLHGIAGNYELRFMDGRVVSSDKIKVSENLIKEDGTYIKLKDGLYNFNIDFNWDNITPAPRDLSLAELKFNERQKYLNTNLLSLEDIRKVWNDDVKLVDAEGKTVQPNAVFNMEGKKVGLAKVDEIGRAYFDHKGSKVFLIDGIGIKGQEKFYVSKTKRDIISSIGMYQELVKLFNPQIELDRTDKEKFNVQRAEIYLNHIKGVLSDWDKSDPEAFGAGWYKKELEEFADKVGRNIKDVKNDVVKLWLFLSTALTSPNTSVVDNAKFAMGAMATIVNFYESGKLTIPKFQYDNDGNLILKKDGTKTQYGLGSAQLEKTDLLTRGYIPASSEEGKVLIKLGGQIVKAGDIVEDSVAPRNKYVFSETAKAMIDRYGALQGVLNFVLSPSLNGKFNKAVDIYGDKLGAFFSNLSGMTQIPTIDTWMNRYFMALTGDAIKVERKRGVLTKITDNSTTFDEKEGNFFRGVIQKATEDWNKTSSKKLDPSDVQAIIWTQIKDLFNDFVNREQDNVDYGQAYSQIVAKYESEQPTLEFMGSKLPQAESNPALLEDAGNKAPIVKELTEGDLAHKYGERFFIESRNGVEFSIKSEEGETKKTKDINFSDERLANAEFEAWIDVAGRLVNGALTDGEIAKILKLSEEKNVKGLEKFVLGLNKTGVLELFVDFLRVNPLIGVKNIVRNLTSNSLHQTADELSRIPASLIDWGLVKANQILGNDNADRSVLMSDFISIGKGIWKGMTQGLSDSYRQFTEGNQVVSFEHPVLFRDRTTGWKLLKPLELYTKYGFRLQESADIPFKVGAYNRALEEIVKIRKMNLERERGEKVTLDEARENLTIADFDHAYDKALYLSFQDDNRIAKSYYQVRDGLSPVGRALSNFMFRYVKTPLNVVSVIMDYSGIYPLIKGVEGLGRDWKGVKDAVNKTLDNPEDRQAIAFGISKGMIGWTTAYIGFRLAQAGMLSAFYEKDDKKEKDTMTAKGTSFGSIIINGVSVEIASLTPISFYLLAGASFIDADKEKTKKVTDAQEKLDKARQNLEKARLTGEGINEAEIKFKEAEKSLKDAERGSVTTSAVSTILKNLAIQAPLVGTGIRLYEDNEMRQKTGKTNFSSILNPNSLIPAIVGETAKTLDRKERVVDNSSTSTSIVDAIKSNIPVLRETLAPKYDMLGREIEAPIGLDPFQTRTVKRDELITELEKYNITITDNTKGSSTERNEAIKQKGQYFEPYLKMVVSSDQYKQADEKTRKKMLEDVIRIMNPEYKKDNYNKDEEKYNIDILLERNLFLQKLNDNPNQFSQDRVITDKKILSNATKAGITELSFYQVLGDIENGEGLEKFISDQFRYNFTVNKDNSLAQAKKNFEEFKKDPELFIVKWYLSQKEYDERTVRRRARIEQLTKEGKTDEEIDKILRKESAKLGWQNRRNRLPKLEMKRDRTREKFTKSRQSENIEDERPTN